MKHTSGKMNNGNIVPKSCKNSNVNATLNRGLIRRQTPIAISQAPNIGINKSGGSHVIVFVTRSFTGLRPSGFRAPSHMNIIDNEYLSKVWPCLCIHSAAILSHLPKVKTPTLNSMISSRRHLNIIRRHVHICTLLPLLAISIQIWPSCIHI